MILWLAFGLAATCAVLTGLLGVAFLAGADKGFEASGHAPDLLPEVMFNRYIGTALFVLVTLALGSQTLRIVVLVIVALIALSDTWIYMRARQDPKKHLLAAILYSIAAGLMFVAVPSAEAAG